MITEAEARDAVVRQAEQLLRSWRSDLTALRRAHAGPGGNAGLRGLDAAGAVVALAPAAVEDIDELDRRLEDLRFYRGVTTP